MAIVSINFTTLDSDSQVFNAKLITESVQILHS